MKSIGSKIFILGFVIAAAVAGIMAFYSTVVAPPAVVPVKNLHKLSLEGSIGEFSDAKSSLDNDSVYLVVADKVDLYRKEELLSHDELSEQVVSLLGVYQPIFINQAYEKFQASEWHEADHEVMLSRIADIRFKKEVYGVVDEYDADLTNIENVIAKYRQARYLASVSDYVSTADAKEKIDAAEDFMSSEYLCNCVELVDMLSMVKINIGNSHYFAVESEVNEMANFRSMSESEFNVLVSTVNESIKEYERNCSMYGSSAKSADRLRELADTYYSAASEYYADKSSRGGSVQGGHGGGNGISSSNVSVKSSASDIRKVVYLSEWQQISSPHASYDAYQSKSNWHVPNSTATLIFTIKGVDSYTFYVRSNGESECDYIIVGLDERPTTSSYISTTKGRARSGTSLDNYNKVTISNLYKSDKYTIYVVYRKDGSVDNGTDRGYVLLPKF